MRPNWIPVLALTDECSLAGIVRAHIWRSARRHTASNRVIVGCELTLEDGPTVVLLACDRMGYGRLSRLVSLARAHAGRATISSAPRRLDLACLVVSSLLVPPSGPCRPRDSANTREWLRQTPRCWIAATLVRKADDGHRLEGAGDGRPAARCSQRSPHACRRRRPLADALGAVRLRSSAG